MHAQSVIELRAQIVSNKTAFTWLCSTHCLNRYVLLLVSIDIKGRFNSISFIG